MDADDTSGHDEGVMRLRRGLRADAMGGEHGIACVDHVPGMLDALLAGDCVCAAAVDDDGACSPARFLEDVAGNEDGRGTECV